MDDRQRIKKMERFFGKSVNVRIDRPIGCLHCGIVYPVNCGYIPESVGSDGKELEVYVLGVDRPLTSFYGKVIGSILRKEGQKDQLVVAPENVLLNQAQIAEAVAFKEQFYHSHIESLMQKSCGAVLFRENNGHREYLLLLQSRANTWSFPKGHMEPYESERQTALREIREETGYTDVVFLPHFRHTVRYPIASKIDKLVVLFLAKVDGNPTLPEKEISGYRWIPEHRVRYEVAPSYRPLMNHVISKLKSRAISGQSETDCKDRSEHSIR